MQYAFLPNQILSSKLNELMTRSLTDLSIQIQGDYHTHEIHKERVYVSELSLKTLGSKTYLVMIMSNLKVIVYESLQWFPNIRSELFRFKIVQAQNLRQQILDWNEKEFKASDGSFT